MATRRRLRGKHLLVAGAGVAAITFAGCGPEEAPPGNLVAPPYEEPLGNLVGPPDVEEPDEGGPLVPEEEPDEAGGEVLEVVDDEEASTESP